MTDSYFIGIDVSKANLDVFVHPDNLYRRYSNTEPGRRRLISDLSRIPDIRLVVFEASGGYERALRQTLANAGVSHACVQPMRVHSFLKAKGYHAKTDKLDAKALALFAASGMARPSPKQDENLLELRNITRSLTFLRRQAATLKCQMEKLGKGYGYQALESLSKNYAEQENIILKAMQQFVMEHKELQILIDLLVSMPGIGFYTACVIASELPELGDCSKAEIAALTGTAPYTRQSGTWQGKASIKGGRHYARRALYMAALTASRFNSHFKKIYEKLRTKGKPFKVAITAIMRKIAIALNSMAKNKRPWNESCS